MKKYGITWHQKIYNKELFHWKNTKTTFSLVWHQRQFFSSKFTCIFPLMPRICYGLEDVTRGREGDLWRGEEKQTTWWHMFSLSGHLSAVSHRRTERARLLTAAAQVLYLTLKKDHHHRASVFPLLPDKSVLGGKKGRCSKLHHAFCITAAIHFWD